MNVDIREAEKADTLAILGVWNEFMTLLRHTNSHYWECKAFYCRSSFFAFFKEMGYLYRKLKKTISITDDGNRMYNG